MIINVNDYVKIKLNEQGHKTLAKYHAGMKRVNKNYSPKPIVVDSEGFTRFLLKDVLYIFGDQFYSTSHCPFEQTKV